jgi:hypothetical protein
MSIKTSIKGFLSQNSFFSTMLSGDYLIIGISIVCILVMFKQFWILENASQIKIRLNDAVFGVFDLNQTRELTIKGPKGISTILISNGKVRFKQSPCFNQYCVHQGWLSRAGQTAICLPNHVSVQLIGHKPSYDSLNY